MFSISIWLMINTKMRINANILIEHISLGFPHLKCHDGPWAYGSWHHVFPRGTYKQKHSGPFCCKKPWLSFDISSAWTFYMLKNKICLQNLFDYWKRHAELIIECFEIEGIFLNWENIYATWNAVLQDLFYFFNNTFKDIGESEKVILASDLNIDM